MNKQGCFRLTLLVSLAICFVSIRPTSVFAQTAEQPVAQISSRVDIWKTAVRPDYTEIDEYVKKCGANCGKTPEEVAEKVTAICTSDIEKARAIFDWLAYYIAYDTTYSTYSSEAAFKKRKSVCNGYAELFVEMGDHVGLNTVFVTGDAKNNLNYKPSGSLTSGVGGGHAWNLVKLEDREIIIDATWGAGYVNGSRFTREFKPYWFDVHPAEAIFTHFPTEMAYQLLEPTISYSLFKQLPHLSPILGYSGINPGEILKHFLEHPEDSTFPFYDTLSDVALAGVKFEKLPFSAQLIAGEEYEVRYRPCGKITLVSSHDVRYVENSDGSVSMFFTGKKGTRIGICPSNNRNSLALIYYFVDKKNIFSKRNALKIGMPRTIRIPEGVTIGSGFVQTGSGVTDGYFMSNMETFASEVLRFLTQSESNFLTPEEESSLHDIIYNKDDYEPVTGFTVRQCAALCNYKSDIEGFSHCYSVDESGELKLDKTASGYRIATLDEWLFAATEGTLQVPQNEDALAECAWFEWNSAEYVYPVARGKPNAFDLYDMFGNVREIVFDEKAGQYYAIGGTSADDYEEVISLKKYKANKKGVILGSPRLVRAVMDDANSITTQADRFLNDYYVARDYKKAFDWYMVGFEKGSAEAANGIGYMYSQGLYVEENKTMAFEYFLKAANMGYKTACYNVGLYYDEGYVGEVDQEKAIFWYQKAAELGNVSAMYRLSQYYYDGDVLPLDFEKHFEYLKMAIDNGIYDSKAFTDIASCYENGFGTEIDLSLAFDYFDKAAESGSVLGMNRLADFYYEGKGRYRPDYYEAAKWYKKAVEKGNNYAVVQLSKMYYYGFWYNRNIDTALEKVQEAINDGYKYADEYYAELLTAKEKLALYGDNSKLILDKIPRGKGIVEYLEPFTTIDSISEKLSGSKISNPFIFNGLTSEELQSKVIDYMQLVSEAKEFPSETKVLLLVLPENWQKSHSLVQAACSEDVFTATQRRMNGERYRFDESLFGYYDAIIPIQVKSINNYIKKLLPVLKGCQRTDMLLLGVTLFGNPSSKNATTPYYQTCMHDIWKAQIDSGVLPRVIAIGDKTDGIQKNINLLFEADGASYAEKINLFGTPLEMTKEISLGFRNGNLLVCMLSKTFTTKKAFRIYLDETGIKQGSVASLSTFIPSSQFYATMKKGAYDKIACIAKPGKMVMDYAVVKPY